MALTGVVVTAQFISYAYVSPILQTIAEVPPARISLLLLVFGLAGLVGNFAISPLMQRSPGAAVLFVASGIGISLVLMMAAVHSPGAAMLVMPVWGLFAGAISVAIQSFVTREAHDHEEAGTALNSAVYNLAIASGAGIGGAVIDLAGHHAVLGVSAVMVGCGVLLAARWQLTRA